MMGRTGDTVSTVNLRWTRRSLAVHVYLVWLAFAFSEFPEHGDSLARDSLEKFPYRSEAPEWVMGEERKDGRRRELHKNSSADRKFPSSSFSEFPQFPRTLTIVKGAFDQPTASSVRFVISRTNAKERAFLVQSSNASADYFSSLSSL